MFVVYISGIVDGVEMPVDSKVKTKNPVVKVIQHLISYVEQALFPS